jgi:hypothetical protein
VKLVGACGKIVTESDRLKCGGAHRGTGLKFLVCLRNNMRMVIGTAKDLMLVTAYDRSYKLILSS